MNDIILNKKESIERCISQVRTYYASASDLDFEDDYIGLMIEVIENHLDDLVLFSNHIVAALGIADPEMNF